MITVVLRFEIERTFTADDLHEALVGTADVLRADGWDIHRAEAERIGPEDPKDGTDETEDE